MKKLFSLVLLAGSLLSLTACNQCCEQDRCCPQPCQERPSCCDNGGGNPGIWQ